MEKNYDIWIRKTRRFTGCIQCSAAYNKNNIPEVLSNGSSRFFCEHHSEDAIEKDINNGYGSVLKIDGTIVATDCFVDNHITRVYVLPEHQKKGYGTFIMKNIEEQIGEK